MTCLNLSTHGQENGQYQGLGFTDDGLFILTIMMQAWPITLGQVGLHHAPVAVTSIHP
jgi:hypothetical protein